MADTKMIELDKMQAFYVLGLDEDGKHVTANSGNITLQDMASFLARARVDLDILIAKTAMEIARKEALASKPRIEVVK